MYRRLSTALLPLAVIALIGTAIWGYQLNQQKQSLLMKAESQYQRAFHNLSYHLDEVHTQLGNALAISAGSNQFQRKCLVNVWRLTSEAQNEVNQLPLTLMPFNETEEFLSKISDFSYQTAIRDLTKEPLNEQEQKTLNSLYQYSEKISKHIGEVQAKVIADHLRWTDVEMVLADQESQTDNAILDGFMTANKQVDEFEDIKWGPTTIASSQKRNYRALAGDTVTEQQILKKANQFLNHKYDLDIQQNGKGTRYSTFSVIASPKQAKANNEQSQIYMDYTTHGGHLIWYMNTRDIAPKQLGAQEAEQKAQQFVTTHKYGQMKTIGYDEYDHIANVTLASEQDGVVIFPDKITVKVALDNGEIVGLQASDYIFEHKDRRTLTKPKITIEQAQKELHEKFKVTDSNLAVIQNDAKKEVLCYEFLGDINNTTFRVFVNADTGMEESIEQLKKG